MTSRPTALLALATLAVLSAANAQSGTATTFTDKRDGKTYRTAVIGKQRWMAENLNFKTGKSVCYDNDESNCQKYGRLYDWNDAMKACPAGWHLPSMEDWDSLAVAVGGQRVKPVYDDDNVYVDDNMYYWEDAGGKLKSKSGWNKNGNGTDEYGFSALPGGGIWSDGVFSSAGDHGRWWSATEYYATSAWCPGMLCDFASVGRYSDYKSSLFSVRCLRE